MKLHLCIIVLVITKLTQCFSKNSNIYKDIKAEGIKIFNNETETVNIGGTAIDIIGLTQNPTEFDEYGKRFL